MSVNPFVIGVCACADMLENADVEACQLGGLQRNIVRSALDEILKRGDDQELQGFTGALSAIVAEADEKGEWTLRLNLYASREQAIRDKRVGRAKGLQS